MLRFGDREKCYKKNFMPQKKPVTIYVDNNLC